MGGAGGGEGDWQGMNEGRKEGKRQDREEKGGKEEGECMLILNLEYLDLVGRSALLDLDSCLAVDAGRAAEGRRYVAACAALKIGRI